MPGREPSAVFLARIRQGEIGGVVLYSENYGPSGPAQLVSTLQAAAKQGGNPPLLIAIDQEGGIVKRLPGDPSLAPPQMATPVIAEMQGLGTARTLRSYGINVDLAPVLDVGHGGFITPRTFGFNTAQVSRRGVSFAIGLLKGHVMPTAKHFPGLGYANVTTDNSKVVVTAPKKNILADLTAFRAAIRSGVPIIMISTATYPTLGVAVPAACSNTIVRTYLRGALGFHGLVITDALDTSALTSYFSVPTAAVMAINSGVDMVLAAGTTSRDANQVSTATYSALLAAATHNRISRRTLELTYGQIMALKRRLLTAGR
jgi:beta-N-acetylhexosaminidase